MPESVRIHRSDAPRAFTLVELLVVIAVVAMLAGLLVPALRSVRQGARASACQANIRSLQRGHLAYAESNRGWMADARLPHGGADQGSTESFVDTLLPFLDDQAAVMRSPLDASPHWPADLGGQGVPVPGSGGRFRRTSYGMNNHLAREFSAWGALDPARVTDRISLIPCPACTVHTLCMSAEGEFAGADHPHVESWGAQPQAAVIASTQVGTAWVGGPPGSADARSNWGFADGHVASEIFGRLYRDETANAFDPMTARTHRP
jgi:prepilin-type N-terminal cleavage/methylation domain-containing protein/prepilin-type processing-associated H-X9-DG protein